jgi:hypothetical protein
MTREGRETMEKEVLKTPEDVAHFLGATVRLQDPKTMLQRVAAAQPQAGTGAAGTLVHRLGDISQQLLVQTGRIEGEYLRRPNALCSIYTPVLAPGATTTFSVQPGAGNSYYRLLGFFADDQQCQIFGFSSLIVGGQEHCQFTQASPSAPVTKAVPWAQFMLREASFKANLAPWSGQVFDQNTPVQGTIVNMTVAASGDAISVASRMDLLIQIDPCGMRYEQIKNASNRYWSTLRANVGAYAPLLSNI